MNSIYVTLPHKLGTIEPNIYGVFAEHIGGVIYDGIYCGEDSPADNIRGFRTYIIEKLKQAKVPLIRWPGGCFAEIYDWRDGIGPREKRPTRINWWTKRDGRYEPNLIGTDEFMDFCNLCEAEPYFAANITSTTPLSIRDWIDYCNSPKGSTTLAKLREENGHAEPYNIKMWGVGNETWGGGGQMTPEYYAMEYRRYAEVMNNTSGGLELIGSGANGGDISWTRKFLENIPQKSNHMSGYSFHYYCGSAGDPLTFSDAEWYRQLAQANRMQELIDRHWGAVIAQHMEGCAKLCIDEWGCWHPDGSGPSKGYNLFEQQSTMRDAMVSALTLNVFNNNCAKIKLATVAQLVNNLHALFLSGDEHCIMTPTYHVFDMYKTHQGGEAVSCVSDCAALEQNLPGLSLSASVKDGILTVTAANLSVDQDIEADLSLAGGKLGRNARITTLAHEDVHAHNTFEEPERVAPVTTERSDFDGKVIIPHGGVVTVVADFE